MSKRRWTLLEIKTALESALYSCDDYSSFSPACWDSVTKRLNALPQAEPPEFDEDAVREADPVRSGDYDSAAPGFVGGAQWQFEQLMGKK